MTNLRVFIPAVSSVNSAERVAEVCEVQVVTYAGEGNLTLTGELGECAQQTALVAISFLCSAYPQFREKYSLSNVHIHVRSENMIDGASCGLGICLALWNGVFSDTTKSPVKVLVTGEIDLFGTVHEVVTFRDH